MAKPYDRRRPRTLPSAAGRRAESVTAFMERMQRLTAIPWHQAADEGQVAPAPVGLGDEPQVLGKRFYVIYTYYRNNGQGWAVRRFTVSCE